MFLEALTDALKFILIIIGSVLVPYLVLAIADHIKKPPV